MPSPSVTYTFTNGTAADASQVNTNFTDLINGVSDGTKDLSISALTCAGTATLNGNINLGNSSADDITITGSLASDFPVKTTGTNYIGSATKALLGVYFGNASNSNTVLLKGGVTTSSYTVTLPTAVGAVNTFLKTDASGVTSWASSGLLARYVYTSADSPVTYTKNAAARFVLVTVVGGGGSGGGRNATGASETSEAAGGGGGGWSKKFILNASLGTTETITIGAGGTAASSGGNGNAGGTTSFGAHCQATGGAAGNSMSAVSTSSSVDGGNGGVGSGGDANGTGGDGGNGRAILGVSVMANFGGSSLFAGIVNAPTGNTTGAAGYVYGGGSAGARGSNTTAGVGAAGATGCCIVEEWV